MKTDHELLQEVADRVTRTESRIVQLGDHVGANLRQKQRIAIRVGASGFTEVEIDALDVSISRVMTELKSHGVRASAVSVRHEGRIVATLYPKALGTVVQPQTQGSK